MVEAINRLHAAAKAAGIRTGIHTLSTSYARNLLDQGFDLVTVAGSDLRMLSAAMAERLAEMRA